ncbi:hypothetical protein B566_EDAN000761 [Ephemera danica]|nr:hypothetical protein B566_EDAN000761 [Ephemera danica]
MFEPFQYYKSGCYLKQFDTMAATKRAWKLQDFSAHDANVTCVALGRKSARVLATGGDDKKVNLWAVGKPNCILSLSGHSTPVECVQFGHTEEMVCAGSQGGALKIWDLEAARLARTLTGHKAAIRCIDHHPYGDFLVSGSFDTFIKLWDIRRKGCIFTYKGHEKPVNSLKFSPDGQWVASGGDDGCVKVNTCPLLCADCVLTLPCLQLWDLRAGKCLVQFSEHSNSVLAVQYHPHEFLLASGSSDRTSNFWDLESFSLASSSDRDAGPVRCIGFSAPGDCLFAASQDCLRVLGWEPARTLDIVPVGWGRVHDMANSHNNQLIAASCHQSSVALYIVDLNRVAPYIPAPPGSEFSKSSGSSNPFSASPSRKSFSKNRPPLGPKARLEVPKSLVEESSSSSECGATMGVDDFPELDDYKDVFKPARSLNRTPPPEPFLPPEDDDPLMPQIIRPERVSPEPPPPPVPATKLPEPKFEIGSPARRKMSAHSVLSQPNRYAESDFPVKSNNIRHCPSEPVLHRGSPSPTPPSHHHSRTGSISGPRPPQGGARTDYYGSTTDLHPPQRSEPVFRKSMLPYEGPKQQEDVRVSPRASRAGPIRAMVPPQSPDPEEALRRMSISEKKHSSLDLLRGHDSMNAVLRLRLRNLQIVFHTLSNKDIKAATECAVAIQDISLMVDYLGVITLKPSLWSLDLCALLLPSILQLLQSKYETYMTVGCSALRLILRNFASVIRNSAGPGSGLGVDISREERRVKARRCLDQLVAIRAFLLKRQTLQGSLGNSLRELHAQMAVALDE